MTTQNTPDNINVELDKVLLKLRTTHEVEHNDNQWTTEFVYTLEEASAQLHKLLVAEKLKEIDVLRNGYGWGDALETSEWILDDREKDLKAQLTPEQQLEGKDG